MTRTIRNIAMVAMVMMIIIGASAPLATAQSNNTTTTTTTTTTAQTENATTETTTTTTTAAPTPTPTQTTVADDESNVCEPSPGNLLSQSRLYAPQKIITANEEGQIAGGFQVAPSNTCPVVVSITLQVPSGMSIVGASDSWSTGAGMTSGQFLVQPDGGIKDIRANVYSTNTGERTVTADITYWPEGHRDQAKEIDGIQLTFDVESASEPSITENQTENAAGGANSGDGGLGPLSNSLIIIGMLGALLLAAIVGLVARGRGEVNVAQQNQ